MNRIATLVVLALFTASNAAPEAKQESPKRLVARVQMAQIGMACIMFKNVNGQDPKALKDLVEKPAYAKSWPEGGFLLGGKVPLDPWGREYRWQAREGRVPSLATLGADGEAGGVEDDADITWADVVGSSDDDRKLCRHFIDNLTQATKNYELDQNAYPASGNASLVKALQTAGPKKLPYFEFPKECLNKKGEVLDPWGSPFVYRNNAVKYPGNHGDATAHNKTSFDIYSFGPDGKDNGGGGDDVNNWD